MKTFVKISLLLLLVYSFKPISNNSDILVYTDTIDYYKYYDSIHKAKQTIFLYNISKLDNTKFRFPVGDIVGNGYYITQRFQDKRVFEGNHLGIDISKPGKPNIDLGDTIYSVGDGFVNDVGGNNKEYISCIYKYNDSYIKIGYFHCLKVLVKSGMFVKYGQPIALIGNSDGVFAAHLHLECMKDTSLNFGGYGDPKGFINPEIILPYYKNK